MHIRLTGWINGRSRETIGGYWGRLGVCLVHRSPGSKPRAVYVQSSNEIGSSVWGEAVIKIEALTGIKRNVMALAIALDADDVFLRTITVPEGLDDAQLEQVAIVEAVSNLPVPPEEICLDFTRVTSDDHDELIGIAFCRRERIDEILACAEEVNIPVHVVDRDVQAIHDAIADKALSEDVVIKYPFCIVLTEVSPRIIICLGPTDFEVYPIRMPLNDIEDSYTSLLTQVGNCWTRCRMSRSIIPDALERLFMVGNVASKVKWPPINPEASVSKQMDILIMNESVEIAPANSFVPDEIVLIALGMSQRRLA